MLRNIKKIIVGSLGLVAFSGAVLFFGSAEEGETAITMNTVPKPYPIAVTSTMDFLPLPPTTCADASMIAEGARRGDPVYLGAPPVLWNLGDVVMNAYVSTTNTVIVRLCNLSANTTTVNPPSVPMRAMVWRF